MNILTPHSWSFLVLYSLSIHPPISDYVRTTAPTQYFLSFLFYSNPISKTLVVAVCEIYYIWTDSIVLHWASYWRPLGPTYCMSVANKECQLGEAENHIVTAFRPLVIKPVHEDREKCIKEWDMDQPKREYKGDIVCLSKRQRHSPFSITKTQSQEYSSTGLI